MTNGIPEKKKRECISESKHLPEYEDAIFSVLQEKAASSSSSALKASIRKSVNQNFHSRNNLKAEPLVEVAAMLLRSAGQ